MTVTHKEGECSRLGRNMVNAKGKPNLNCSLNANPPSNRKVFKKVKKKLVP